MKFERLSPIVATFSLFFINAPLQIFNLSKANLTNKIRNFRKIVLLENSKTRMEIAEFMNFTIFFTVFLRINRFCFQQITSFLSLYLSFNTFVLRCKYYVEERITLFSLSMSHIHLRTGT